MNIIKKLNDEQKRKNKKNINNSSINNTSIILKNKKEMLFQKNFFLTENITQKKNITHSKNLQRIIKKKCISNDAIPVNVLKDKDKKIIKKAYILMKKDIHIKVLEKKFNIEWTEDNINVF